jgi:release factor glutamine methyltransferase
MDNAIAKPLTIGRAVREMSRAFTQAGLSTSHLDARLLAAFATGTGKDLSITNPDFAFPANCESRLAEVQARRLAGEPVHRIIGEREFYGLALRLGPDTLEPRPDTETLVDAVLPFAGGIAQARGTCRVLDLGTGTGAIGLAIASQVPAATVVATDIAAGAVEIANANARQLGLHSRFEAILSDWFSSVAGAFDLIVSNPPYIPAGEIASLDREVRDFDPGLALDGGADGLEAYRAIANGARTHLSAGGRIAVEAGAGQAKAIREIFSLSEFAKVTSKFDLAGIERAIIFEYWDKVSFKSFRTAKKTAWQGEC